MLRCARNDGARGNGFALPVRILNHRRTFSSSRRISPELCSLHRPSRKEGAGKAGCRLAPTIRCAKAHAEKLHSGIQVKPYTRPSLRGGWTAYAVLSREPSSFWPPSLPRNSPAPRRLTRLPPSQELDRSNDGQDHTVLPYAFSAVRLHAAADSQGLPALPAPSRADAAASTATRPAFRTTREPPLFVGPGCFDVCRNSEFR